MNSSAMMLRHNKRHKIK